MQKYATAVHNREYCAYQTNMCKNVQPKPHPYISGIICTISTPAFTLSNGQYSLHFFKLEEYFSCDWGFLLLLKKVGLKLAKNIPYE